MSLRRAHWIVGLCTLVVFLGTGQYILEVAPPGEPSTELTHYIMTATHIYVMFAGLLNLILGLHLQPSTPGLRQHVQRLGSVMILTSPILLVAAFFLEAPLGPTDREITAAAVLLGFFGVGFQFAARAPARIRGIRPAPKPAPAHTASAQGLP